MSFTVNATAANVNTSGTSIAVSISIASGHTVACIAYHDGTGTISLADSASNAYTAGNTVTSAFNQEERTYYSIGIASSITSVTLSSTTADFIALFVWDITATGTISYSDSLGHNYNFTSVTTTDGTSTGTLSLGSSTDGLLLAIGGDPGGGPLTVGTGFTADATTATAQISEHKAVSASTAATFTDATSGTRPIVMGLMLAIAGAAPSIGSWQPIRPLSPPGVSPGRSGRFYQSPKSFFVPSNVTLSLTGQNATFSAGALTPSLSAALAGQGGTFSAGALVPSFSVPLLGSIGTFTAGNVTVAGNLTLSLTGQAAAFGIGVFGVIFTIPGLGASATLSSGVLGPGTSPGLAGAAGAFSGGGLIPSSSVVLVGAGFSGTPGSLAPLSQLVALGASATFSQGILNPSLTIPLTGIFQPTAAGTITASGGNQTVTQTGSMLLIRRGFRNKR